MKSEYFYNINFIFDVYVLLTKNLNPFSIKIKLDERNIAGMIYMLLDDCVPSRFYKFIWWREYFLYYNGIEVLYSKTAKIVLEHAGENLENYIQMRESSKNTTKFSNAFTCTYFWNCSLVVNFMCKTKLYILKKWPTIWSPLANWKTSMKERYNNKICRETTMQNFILSTSARSTMLSILIFTKSNFKRLQKWRRSKLSSHFHWTR